MARAIRSLGFFIFEDNELRAVSKVLKAAKLKETLKILPLGTVRIELANDNLETGYYAVVLDNSECLRSCENSICIERCVKDRKESVAEAILESLGEIREESGNGLDKVFKKLTGAGGGI